MLQRCSRPVDSRLPAASPCQLLRWSFSSLRLLLPGGRLPHSQAPECCWQQNLLSLSPIPRLCALCSAGRRGDVQPQSLWGCSCWPPPHRNGLHTSQPLRPCFPCLMSSFPSGTTDIKTHSTISVTFNCCRAGQLQHAYPKGRQKMGFSTLFMPSDPLHPRGAQ